MAHHACRHASVVVEAYAAAVLELGEHISMPLDMKLEMKHTTFAEGINYQ